MSLGVVEIGIGAHAMVLDSGLVIDSCGFFFIGDSANVSLFFINHDQNLPLVPISGNSSVFRSSEAVGWLVKSFSNFVCRFNNKLVIVSNLSKGSQEFFFLGHLS